MEHTDDAGEPQIAIRLSLFPGGLLGSAFQPTASSPGHAYHSGSADCLVACFPLDTLDPESEFVISTDPAVGVSLALTVARAACTAEWESNRVEVKSVGKLRIVISGFGTARQIMVLERWTNPKSLGDCRSCRYLTLCRGVLDLSIIQ